VLTALESLTTSAVVIATVDMPNVGGEPLRWLVEQLGARPQALGVMCAGTGRAVSVRAARGGGRRRARSSLARQRSVWRLSDDPSIVCPPAPSQWPEEVWQTLNTPADLPRAPQ
jgi:molybdopterin-guanine dinucleotide biosynthesis protein A